MKNLFPPLLFVACSLVTAAARADLPPDDGTKRVTYAFSVHGIAAVPAEKAMFAYPCTGSNGAPGTAATPLSEGSAVEVGRFESCAIYMTSRAALDAWSTTNRDPSGLVGAAVKCSGGPTVVTSIDADDPRTSVKEELDVKVDAASCSVISRGVPTRSTGGCNASGTPRDGALALLLGLPAILILRPRKRTRKTG